MTDVTVDRPRASALIITAAGLVYEIGTLEGFTFSKSENGDAGEFSLSFPLAANKLVSVDCGPMDLVAIFAARTVTWAGGRKGAFFNEGSNVITLDSGTLHSMKYGGANASETKKLQKLSSLVCIGMIDKVTETQIYEGQPKASLEIVGRDLTKIFLDNDTFVSYTLPGSDPSHNAIANLEQISLSISQTGTQLLKSVLNIFCKKDAKSVAPAIGAPDGDDNSARLLAMIAQYGYPWDNFIDQTKLVDAFEHISPSAYPPYQVKSGSVWANVLELRNWPIARLFINELGQIIFDDALFAYQGRPIASRIETSEIRQLVFMQSDENVVTSLTVLPSLAVNSNSQLAALAQSGHSRTPENVSAITRFGYRWWSFTSLYDSVDDLSTSNPGNVLARRFQLLWLIKNNFWRAQVTVKGTTRHRVGQRVFLNTGGANPSTQFHNWYIAEIGQQFGYGDDWTTTLSLTYPDGKSNL